MIFTIIVFKLDDGSILKSIYNNLRGINKSYKKKEKYWHIFRVERMKGQRNIFNRIFYNLKK